jgi:hypothetical protein
MKKILFIAACMTTSVLALGQQFEQPKIDPTAFKEVKVNIGADFAIQYQALDHHADGANLINLGSNFNLPTANLNLNTDLAPGIKVNLVTYLSARHHNESWVKGGYLVIDNMPFLPGSDAFMKYLTITAGVMQPNVGDQMYRRSDNGNVINNVFVGNYVMDDMTTNTGVEFLFRNNGIIAMVGANSGNLKPALGGTHKEYRPSTSKPDSLVYDEYNLVDELAYVWKLGIDKQVNEDLRIRAALSGSICSQTHSTTLHSGDRTGSRYYLVMNTQATDGSDFDITKNHLSGNFGPASGVNDNTIVANIFGQYKGFEIFGTYEKSTGDVRKSTTTPVTPTAIYYDVPYDFTQIAIEGVYRFGKQRQWQLGARYNTVSDAGTSDEALAKASIESGKTDVAKDLTVNRLQLAAGWYMTKNVVTKIEYVDQNYVNWKKYGENAGFEGVMLEAAISF